MTKLSKSEAEKYILALIEKQPYKEEYLRQKKIFLDTLDDLYKRIEKDFPDSTAQDVDKIFKEHYKFDQKAEQKKIKETCSKIISWFKDNKPIVEGFEWKFKYSTVQNSFYEFPGVFINLVEKENENHYFQSEINISEVTEKTGESSGTEKKSSTLSKEEARTLITQLIESCPKLSEYNGLAEEFWHESVEYLSHDKTYETISVTTETQLKAIEKANEVCAEFVSWATKNVTSKDSNGNDLKWEISPGMMRNFNAIKIKIIQKNVSFTGVLEVFSAYREGDSKYFPQNIDALFKADSTTIAGSSSSGDGGQTSSTTDKTGSGTSNTERATSESIKAANQNDKSHVPITQELLEKTLGIAETMGFSGNKEEVKKRQHMLDMTKYDEEYKKPNPNKFPNNDDPYPVDLKIEELEAHAPNVKLYTVLCHKKAKEAAIAAMEVSKNSEKRIVKLENIIATLMRLIFRMGTRVPINCQYYGGQTVFEKYKGIRCMCDDRIQDGQMVQIDQCLYCTRYEPVYGQVYELLNDTGANVAAILDDNQMSYRNMEQYVTDARSEKYHDETQKASIDMSMINTRDKSENDFEDLWGKGIAMNWQYVPKEMQKCHINWRQSLNDDGSNIGRLESFPQNEANSGSNIVNDTEGGKLSSDSSGSGSSSGGSNSMTKQKDAMENYVRSDNYVKEAINNGKNLVNTSLDDSKNKISADYQNDIKKALGEDSDVDMLTIACLTYATGEDYNSVISKYKNYADKIGTKNPALIISAYGCDNVEVIIGSKEGNEQAEKDKTNTSTDTKVSNLLVRIDKVTYPKKENENVTLPSLDWDKRDSWLWADFSERLLIQNGKLGKTVESASLFPKVCYLYCELNKVCLNSPYDTEEYAFPFSSEELKKGNGIYYTSPFGPRWGGVHRGVDLATDIGVPFRAVHDGTITSGNEYEWDPNNHAICLDHGDGTYSRYLHGVATCPQGQKVKKGEIIGTVGNYGPKSTGPHLHFEMCSGDSMTTRSDTDPFDFFPKIKGVAVLDQRIPCD